MDNQVLRFSTEFASKPLSFEVGRLAMQANGSVVVTYGHTVVLVTAVMGRYPREGMGFFPLTVDFEEKLYAAGMIKTSRFMKREGRPTDEAVINGRMIDRTVRPRFGHGVRNDVQVIVTALAVDGENDPDVPAIIGASLALMLSDIPWDGPLGAVRVAKVGDKVVFNPTYAERASSTYDLLVCGDGEVINMIEFKGAEISESELVEYGARALEMIKVITAFQAEIVKQHGRHKSAVTLVERDKALEEKVSNWLKTRLTKAVYHKLKTERLDALHTLKDEMFVEFAEAERPRLTDIFEEELDKLVRHNVLEKGVRPDGRAPDAIRPIKIETSVLPRVHGSALFQRGLTQALSVVTLAGPGQEQFLEGMEIVGTKRYMHHYNFPPFSVGETAPLRGPGRRDIGHGMLAEKAIEPLLPPKDKFPYTVRVVSEILSSNGSSSMASVCGSSLALFDAGVPMKNAAAGISIGLMTGAKGKHVLLTDIQGPEDHHGDMDFKVAGTDQGVTAIQMDVKIKGISLPIFEEALTHGRHARLEILDAMKQQISAPRPELAPTAPKVMTTVVARDKIRDVIGPGGRIINAIIELTGAQIDIEDNGEVYVTAESREAAERAMKMVKDITRKIEVGEVFAGRISRMLEFGAFAELAPGVEGLIHISRMAPYRVRAVEDIVEINDKVVVKVIEVDEVGRYNLELVKNETRPVPPAPPSSPNMSGAARPGMRPRFMDRRGGQGRDHGRDRGRDRFRGRR